MLKLVRKVFSKNGEGELEKVHRKVMSGVSLMMFSLFVVSSCTEDVEEVENDKPKMESSYKNGGQLRLGKKIHNPYSLKVVQQAYDELTGTRSGVKLSATHLYLKFAPKDIEELRLLEADTTLYFYSYPLDVELIGEGGGYHDPSLPDTVPTYQYVCAPVGHKLPDVQYEVLDEVYYEEEGEENPTTRSNSAISWEQLEEKAYLLAGDSSINSTPETRLSQWRAGGRLRYEDNYLNTIVALEGVPVRMRYHVITYQNCTDKNGYFQSPKTKSGDCKYSIEWKRDVFRIIPEHRLFVTADYVIQENKSRVDKIFKKCDNVDQWIYASLFIPAHEYFYGDRCGTQSPEKNIEITPKTEDKEQISGNCCPVRPKEIRIFRYYSNNKEKNSASYYGTTIHELAHSAHCEYVGLLTFALVDDCVADSWAVGVQDYFSLRKYGRYGRLISHSSYGSQYTGVVNDLRDNDVEDSRFNQGYYYDKVSGYTLLDVQKALKGVTKWATFKNQIKNVKSIDDETKKNIDDLFYYWHTL